MFQSLASFETIPLVVSVMGVAALVLMGQAAWGVFHEAKADTAINRRLKAQKKTGGSTDALMVTLRKQRGLTEDGEFALPVVWFNQLVTRSGVTFRPLQWGALALVAGVTVAAIVILRLGAPLMGLLAGVGVFALGPIVVLKVLGGQRMAKLSKQLPDALQIVTRSLEAGHPVPTAVSLVAREMPDPIGTEFGMAADEVAYGFSLSQAIQRMAMRAGDPDIELFAATVRLQEKTGGNLRELLQSNSETIRDRQTLRLKVRAASSEGRASAMILTAAPFIVVTGVHLMKPDFYGTVMHEKSFQYIVAGFGVWLVIGNLIMRQMINFKF